VAGSSPPGVAGCRAFLLAGCKRHGWPVWCVFCSINRTTVVLYDKAHKEGLKGDLSRFEVRLVSKDIKGCLIDEKAILELLNSIHKVLKRYKVFVGSKLINFEDFDVENRWLLNSYNNYS
jgi:hypothetical protein